jgi:chromosomal replication initiation ATPase DnaA
MTPETSILAHIICYLTMRLKEAIRVRHLHAMTIITEFIFAMTATAFVVRFTRRTPMLIDDMGIMGNQGSVTTTTH